MHPPPSLHPVKPNSRAASALLAALFSTSALPAASAVNLELQELREQIAALEHKLLVLERKQEIQDEKVAVTDKGVTLSSADSSSSIRLRGLVQLDSRLYFGDNGSAANAFALRRARLFFEGGLSRNVSYQLVPELAGGTATAATTPSILDANFTFTLRKVLQLKFGKFKSPIGLEMLQSEQATSFNERSLASNLVPNRDLGVLAGGDLFKGTASYTAGILNGMPDGGSSTNADFDNEKDGVARIFATPFKNDAGSAWQGLSFGISGNWGRAKSASGRTAGYRTDGQQTFFAYSATTIADGQSWRVSPQLDYRHGSFGLMGEYVLSTVNVRASATGPKAELQNHAWQLAAGYVLTGEDSSYSGITPAVSANLANGTWGAFEVTARVANLKVDDAAFPLFASAATNANEATAFGVGLNWYLAKSVVFKFDYFQTRFGFAPGAPAVASNAILRQDEQAFISRLQLSF